MVLDPTSSLPVLLPRGPWWVRSGPGLAWKAGGGGLAIQGFPTPSSPVFESGLRGTVFKSHV